MPGVTIRAVATSAITPASRARQRRFATRPVTIVSRTRTPRRIRDRVRSVKRSQQISTLSSEYLKPFLTRIDDVENGGGRGQRASPGGQLCPKCIPEEGSPSQRRKHVDNQDAMTGRRFIVRPAKPQATVRDAVAVTNSRNA